MSTIKIRPDGEIVAVWNDDLAPLVAEGGVEIKRASHVEPTTDGKWEADMFPIGGPVLGPFSLRGQALEAEHDWLETAGY